MIFTTKYTNMQLLSLFLIIIEFSTKIIKLVHLKLIKLLHHFWTRFLPWQTLADLQPPETGS